MGVKTCESTDPYSLRISMFGARSAFTHVTACTLAESPSDPLHRKLRQLRCLRCRLDCFYRVERTSSRAGVSPAEVQCLSRRTVTPTSGSFRGADHSSSIVSVVINFEHLDELALGGYDCPHRLIS